MSPTVRREKGFRFFFFSREEPRCHVHVQTSGGEAKFWLDPRVELARNYCLSRNQLKEAEGIIAEHHDEFVHAWKQHFES